MRELINLNFITWVIAIFGVITFAPLMVAQFLMILNPQSQNTKDLIIGKGGDWRDKSHFKYSLAFGWADLLVIFPLFVLGTIGVFSGLAWGYALWLSLGLISIYFSIIFWIMEKEYTLPVCGKLAYYTYIWGFFFYWGIIVIVYSVARICT